MQKKTLRIASTLGVVSVGSLAIWGCGPKPHVALDPSALPPGSGWYCDTFAHDLGEHRDSYGSCYRSEAECVVRMTNQGARQPRCVPQSVATCTYIAKSADHSWCYSNSESCENMFREMSWSYSMATCTPAK